ncbi:MAG: alpha-hydroxy acid oxidase, partial [Burkholderiales bacterium]
GVLWPHGDLATARATAQAGVGYCLSTNSNASIEEVAAQGRPDFWFQLYVQRDRGMARSLVERARAAGCPVLCVTVDLPIQGPRERDERNGFTVPPRFSAATLLDFALHFRWLLDVALGPKITFRNFLGTGAASSDAVTITQFIAGQYDLTVSWRDVDWFKAEWGGPVLLKGILSSGDAKLAAAHGVDGVIVSNHGGRQLEGALSAISALPPVVDAVEGRIPVLLDGGVRRGADVVKALALGARACMVGRAWLYGLASGGKPGVERALTILRDEIDLAMALLGRPTIAELDRSALVL